MTAGTTCVNFTAGSASNIFTEQITGGTGRFKNASGTLTVVVPASYPILFDSTGQPVLIVLPSGEVTGTIVLSQ